jgi:hypothetical protein
MFVELQQRRAIEYIGGRIRPIECQQADSIGNEALDSLTGW